MRRSLATAALLLATTALAGCGGSADPEVAVDAGTGTSTPSSPDTPHSSVPGAAAMPTAVPAAPGAVRTRDLSTVIDDGTGAGTQVCLGPTTEIYPPSCGGPVVEGWRWGAQRGTFQSEGGVRFGQFMLTGTFDGTALTYQGAVPAALYDAGPATPEPTPSPATTYDDDRLADIAAQVGDLPGAAGAAVQGGQVLVDVTYDDGSLQAWADEAYGAGVVLVTGQLVDVEG